MSFYKQFRAFSFKSHSTNPMRRITRKSAASDDFVFFPPEEHVYIPINAYTYLYFGGARRGQESTWNMFRNIYKISFIVDDNDVNIDCISDVIL